MLRLKTGDTVQVIAGDEKGRRGKILRVDLVNKRVVVQGINLVYKHIRRSQKYPQGGRIQKESPLAISKVLLVDADEDRPVRFRSGTDKNGKKIRVSVKSGKPI